MPAAEMPKLRMPRHNCKLDTKSRNRKLKNHFRNHLFSAHNFRRITRARLQPPLSSRVSTAFAAATFVLLLALLPASSTQ